MIPASNTEEEKEENNKVKQKENDIETNEKEADTTYIESGYQIRDALTALTKKEIKGIGEYLKNNKLAKKQLEKKGKTIRL